MNPIQKEILDKLYYERIFVTTRSLATKTGYSWQTVEKHLKELLKKKFVEMKQVPFDKNPRVTRPKWRFNYKYYKKLKSRSSN